MGNLTIGVIVGSNRRDSLNRKLADGLIGLGSRDLTFQHLRIDDLPMYNADLEERRPDEVDRFTAATSAVQGLLIVTPEHNRSLPAVLKNAIDWGSKPADKNVWRDMPIAITGTSPGAIGTALAQQHLRVILGNLGAIVMGGEAYVQFKPGLIDDEGKVGPASKDFLQGFMDRFTKLAGKLRAA